MRGEAAIYILLVIVPFVLLSCIGLMGIFKKAGGPSWFAFVPGLNLYTWLKITGRPVWWLGGLFVPVLGFVLSVSMAIDMAKVFGKDKFGAHLLMIIGGPIYLLYLGFSKDAKYEGYLTSSGERKKSEAREWADAILFAGAAALLIRTFFLEAFMIPTTSMEGSLLAGDFLFVSKFHYGVRMPMVPFAIPFIHNRIPGTSMKSYLPFPYLPYFRLPGIKTVERNDIVVFNYPENDVQGDVGEEGIVHPQVPMKQNYIKRCVGLPGDTLQIIDGQLMINNQPAWTSPNAQFSYLVVTKGISFNEKFLNQKGFRYKQSRDPNQAHNANVSESPEAPFHYEFNMSDTKAEEVKHWPNVERVEKIIQKPDSFYIEFQTRIDKQGQLYPKNPRKFPWTMDNFGPLVIPKAGMTIELKPENIDIYRRCIKAYEGHMLDESAYPYKIDGNPASTYTFQLDYYWMMGDNRHQSLDSRFWGFVPEDHIVGRPWMVVISMENGIRWNRLFSPVTRWEP